MCYRSGMAGILLGIGGIGLAESLGWEDKKRATPREVHRMGRWSLEGLPFSREEKACRVYFLMKRWLEPPARTT